MTTDTTDDDNTETTTTRHRVRPDSDFAPHPRNLAVCVRLWDGDAELVRGALRAARERAADDGHDATAERFGRALESFETPEDCATRHAPGAGDDRVFERVYQVTGGDIQKSRRAVQSYGLSAGRGHTADAAWSLGDRFSDLYDRLQATWRPGGD